jgi:hypothetical protein
MSHAIRQLAEVEPDFLQQNFKVDSEYFDIQPLQTRQPKKKARK